MEYQRRLELNREYYWRNRDELISKKRQYREKNREKMRAYYNAYFKRPEAALKKLLIKHVRRARKLSSSDGTVTAEAIRRLLQKQENACAMCKERLDKYHIDHIKPISKGGAHSIKNIQILCPFCNISKADKYDTNTSAGQNSG